MKQTYSKANEIVTAVVYKYLAVGYQFSLQTMSGFQKVDLMKDRTLIRIEIDYDKNGEYKVVVRKKITDMSHYLIGDYVPTVFSKDMETVEEIKI